MKKTTRFLIAAGVLVGAVAYLMYTGVQQTAVYYLTIGEFLAKREALADEGVRVAGRVAPGSVSRRFTDRGEEVKFQLGDFTDGPAGPDQTIPVYFVGIVPDMFKTEGGSDVIVEGTFRGGTLQAQSVMTSCPSKYEADAAKHEADAGAGAAGRTGS